MHGGPSLKGVLIARVCAWCMQPHSKSDLLVEFDGFLEGFYLVLVLSGDVLFHQSLLELFGHPQHLDIAHLFRQIFYLHVKLLKLPGRERGKEEGKKNGKNVNHSAVLIKYTVILTIQVHEFPS